MARLKFGKITTIKIDARLLKLTKTKDINLNQFIEESLSSFLRGHSTCPTCAQKINKTITKVD